MPSRSAGGAPTVLRQRWAAGHERRFFRERAGVQHDDNRGDRLPDSPVLARILLILDTARPSNDAARVSHVPHDQTTPFCGERRVGSGDRLVERLVT